MDLLTERYGGCDTDQSVANYFQQPDETPDATLNVRVEESTKVGLEALTRFWQMLAITGGTSKSTADKTITVTSTARRLLRVGLEGAFAEALKTAGLDAIPRSESDWARLEKALTDIARKRG
jgi:hypothetical protein